MKLTRRDALVAVAASAAGVATAGEAARRLDRSDADEARLERVLRGFDAAASVVFPTEVSSTDDFLATFVRGKAGDRSEYLSACSAALDELDRQSNRRYGRDFEALSADRREAVLVDAGVADVPADPDGTALERIRYYVVNELLYALYASPTGGELLGNENPPGYPGGQEAYQRGPGEAESGPDEAESGPDEGERGPEADETGGSHDA